MRLPRGLGAGRALDFMSCAPILATCAALRRKRELPENPESIVLLSAPTIGDTLLTGALVSALRGRWPVAKIHFAAFSSNRVAAEVISGVDGVIIVDPFRLLRSVRRIRDLRPSIIVDTSAWPHVTATLAAASGAFSVGFRRHARVRHVAYDAVVMHRDDRHEIENYQGLLDPLGIDVPVGVPSPEMVRVKACAEQLPDGPFVVFHPWASGSGKQLKQWPIQHWVELAEWVAELGFEIVITGGRADESDSDHLAHALRQTMGTRVRSLAGALSLSETAWAMQQSELVFSVNTGAMHLGALVGASVVGLHGPTSPDRWGPVGARSRAVGPAPGGGFLSLGFEFAGQPEDTMERLAPSEAIRAGNSLLSPSQ